MTRYQISGHYSFRFFCFLYTVLILNINSSLSVSGFYLRINRLNHLSCLMLVSLLKIANHLSPDMCSFHVKIVIKFADDVKWTAGTNECKQDLFFRKYVEKRSVKPNLNANGFRRFVRKRIHSCVSASIRRYSNVVWAGAVYGEMGLILIEMAWRLDCRFSIRSHCCCSRYPLSHKLSANNSCLWTMIFVERT